jgi:CBS domain containing-hemolysin-like protein
MVPRRKIAALDINTPLHEVIGIVAQSPYSGCPSIAIRSTTSSASCTRRSWCAGS